MSMSGVKLFGTTIQLPFDGVVSDDRKVSCCLDDDKYNTSSTTSYSKSSDGPPSITMVDHEPCKSSIGGDSPKTPSQGNEASSFKSSKTEEQSDTSMSQEKTLKKPDKLLPCPRCKSMDTKFCYFNNYNVNQPRHFCKKCQRYWTAGGTMRNVPIGAGRRKSKNSLKFQQPPTNNFHGCFPPHPWAPVQWGPTMPPQPYMPFWGCAPPGSWPMTWMQTPNSHLGKHTRDQEQHGEESSKKEPKLLVPKTPRHDSINSIGLFGGFRPKGGEISSVPEASFALQANPAALSRSVTFRESAQ